MLRQSMLPSYFQASKPRDAFGSNGPRQIHVHADTATVSRLLSARGPLAVIWFVVAVVVFSLKRQARWLFSHVGQEVDEGGPPLAYRDAASAIARVRRAFLIQAALPHAEPDSICASLFAGSAVCAIGNRQTRLLQASARLDVPEPKAGGDREHIFAAIASAVPNDSDSAPVRFANNDQRSKPLVEYVDHLRTPLVGMNE